ncbi:MAG: flagellar hook protein FlgE [Nitriliruptoraceae bacterium]|jgi:flagellar hook protein FlgE
MLRSMFSAISGIRAHQTMMDVVGNNIANVNTAGYKSARATFQESLTQVSRGATQATAVNGGSNPFQIGLGTMVATIESSFTQGSTQMTGRATDVAIQGDGFFAVESGGQLFYERAGSFNVDAAGNLVGVNGEFVLGGLAPVPGVGAATNAPDITNSGDPAQWEATDYERVTLDLTAYSDPKISVDGTVTARHNTTGELHTVARIALATFASPNGLVRGGNGLYTDSANAGLVGVGWPAEGPRGSLESGTLEMSNVDLATEFTNMIIAQRGFQANSRTVTASDEILTELVNMKR